MSSVKDSKDKDPADWKEWKKIYQNTIRHSQFEWNFAIEVIPNVKGLKPSQVIPQHPFIGRDGREYHMDFAIISERVNIAIELEGWDKTNTGTGKTKKEHDDFNRRIQDLTRLGWKVLTITNAQFMADKLGYANEIRQLMSEPQTEVVVVAKQDNSEVLDSINKLHGTVNKLRAKKSEYPPTTVVIDNSETLARLRKSGIAGFAVIAVLIAMLIFTISRNGNEPIRTPPTERPVVSSQYYEFCKDLKKDYPDGIAESQAAKDKRPKSKAKVDKSVYDTNVHLDGGYGNAPDGVFCDT